MLTNLFLSVLEISLSVSLIVAYIFTPFKQAVCFQMELLDLDLSGSAACNSLSSNTGTVGYSPLSKKVPEHICFKRNLTGYCS